MVEVVHGLIAALASGGLVATVAKHAIAKALRQLDEVAEKVGEIREELSAISVKLEYLDKHHDLLQTHDRKIAGLEVKVHARATAAPCHGKSA